MWIWVGRRRDNVETPQVLELRNGLPSASLASSFGAATAHLPDPTVNPEARLPDECLEIRAAADQPHDRVPDILTLFFVTVSNDWDRRWSRVVLTDSQDPNVSTQVRMSVFSRPEDHACQQAYLKILSSFLLDDDTA